MLTGEIRGQVDPIWNACRSGGLSFQLLAGRPRALPGSQLPCPATVTNFLNAGESK